MCNKILIPNTHTQKKKHPDSGASAGSADGLKKRREKNGHVQQQRAAAESLLCVKQHAACVSSCAFSTELYGNAG